MSRRRFLSILSGVNHANSLDLDGSTEDIVNTTNNTWGFANAWTVSFWWKGPGTHTDTTDQVFQMRNSSNAQSAIGILIQGNVTNDPFQVQVVDSAAVIITTNLYESIATSSWALWTLTWDGSAMVFYKNGVALTPTSSTPGAGVAMADTARRIGIGCNLSGLLNTSGRYHSLAIWNTALSAAQVLEIYNNGNGTNYNIRNMLPDNIIHWTLLGYAAGDLFHNEIGTINVGANQANISDADIVQDSPL